MNWWMYLVSTLCHSLNHPKQGLQEVLWSVLAFFYWSDFGSVRISQDTRTLESQRHVSFVIFHSTFKLTVLFFFSLMGQCVTQLKKKAVSNYLHSLYSSIYVPWLLAIWIVLLGSQRCHKGEVQNFSVIEDLNSCMGNLGLEGLSFWGLLILLVQVPI